MSTAERREALLIEIACRMKGAGEENLRLLAAMDMNKQPTNALESWLAYLERAKIQGRDDHEQ